MKTTVQKQEAYISVIKIGGSTYQERSIVLKDVALLKKAGNSLVLVHGGGKEIDRELRIQGINPFKIDGKRVTNAKVLKIVVEQLDRINKEVGEELESLSVIVCSFSSDSGFLQAKMGDPKWGYIGESPRVRTNLLKDALARGLVPIVCPVTTQKENSLQKLNTNADTVAGAVAAYISPCRLIFLTDVEGVLDESGSVIKKLTIEEYKAMKRKKIIIGGMLPKIDACLPVVKNGGSVLICKSSNLRASFSKNPIGTIVTLD